MNDTSLKAKIRNIAREKKLPAQLVLQNYLFERFLYRISKTEYRDSFVIKGGTLISSIIGLTKRTTLDLDTTLQNLPLTPESIQTAVEQICAVDVEDGFVFSYKRMEPIRDDDQYGGYRVSFMARFGKIDAPMSMDVSTGDIMTPGAEQREFLPMFTDEAFSLWTYNIETILGEKAETILSRNIYTTRPRDFYDVYALVHSQTYDRLLFEKALAATAEHRGSREDIRDIKGLLAVIAADPGLQKLWDNYRRQFSYAAGIEYEQIIATLEELLDDIQLS